MSCASSWQSEPNDDEPEKELLRRLDACEQLLPFCRYVTPWFQTPRHIQYVAPFYEAVERGDIDRLMVLMPPRHGKTQLGLRFAAWYVGRNPSEELVCASYNSRIAGLFGAKVRNIIASQEYRRLCCREFGAELRPDSQAKDLWHTTRDGVFLATGLGGGATGFGANGLLIDDYLKGRKEADSETIREDIEQWYSGEAYPRLMPRSNGRSGWVLMEYTPWHELDLGQRELQAMLDGPGDKWWVVRLPGVAEPNDLLDREVGEALWRERYPIDRLHRIKAVLDRLNPRDWPALYQCRPAALEGTFYKREHFPDLPEIPAPGRRSYLLVTDWATGTGTDYTVHGVFALDSRGDIEVVDWWRRRCETDVGVDAALDLVAKYQAMGSGMRDWVYAKGPIDAAVSPLVRLRMRERNIHCPVTNYAETGSKEALSQGIQGRMAAGRVRFPHRAPWFSDLLRECLAAWSGANDDQCDVLKMLGLHLDKVVSVPEVAFEMQAAKGSDALW